MLAVGSALAADSHPGETLRGKLVLREGKPPVVETAEHKLVTLDGDEPTRKVLGDQRLNGFEVEAKGHFTAPDRFLIDPIQPALYWSGRVVSSRWLRIGATHVPSLFHPGPCVCCQRETTLDLRDPDEL